MFAILKIQYVKEERDKKNLLIRQNIEIVI